MANIKIENKDNYSIMVLNGSYRGYDDSDDLRDAFSKSSKDGIKNLVVDFSNVDYIDSKIVGAILSGNSIYNKINGKFIICNAQDYVDNIFNITKIGISVTICRTDKEAIEILNK